MRFVLIVLLFLAAAVPVLRAQEQERKLMDRILSPDKSRPVLEQNKTFNGGRAFQSASGSRTVKSFYFTHLFLLKPFTSREFAGTKDWQGNFKYTTKSAEPRGWFGIPGLGKTFHTKTMDTKEAAQSGKTFASRDFADARAFTKQGASQGTLDLKQQKPQMTIDQIRDLLNKGKIGPAETD